MKKILIAIILATTLIASTYSENFINDYLTGIWYKAPNTRNPSVKEYSWGLGYSIPNFTLNINLYEDNASISVPMLGGPFSIEEIETIKEKEQYIMTIYFDRGGFNAYYYLNICCEENYIWFEDVEGNDVDLIPTEYLDGETFYFYKISGPEIKLPTTLIEEYEKEQAKKAEQEYKKNPQGKDGVVNDTNVRLRKMPTLDSEIMGIFNKGDKLFVQGILAGKQKIDNVEALWYKVYHPDFGEGWIFGAYVDVEGVKNGESIF